MKDEIAAAVVFMVGIVKRNKSLNQEQLSKIGDNLALALFEKYRNHWYEDRPSKGQGFRCIRISGDTHEPREAMLLKVARRCGIKYSDLKLPLDLTVWVDPCEVACRFGEKGTTMTIATFPRKATSSPESVNMETRSSSTGSSPVTSDSESDSESSSSHRHAPTFQPLNFVSNESRFYHAYRRNGRHQQYRSANHVSYAARDKYRWVNNPVIVLA